MEAFRRGQELSYYHRDEQLSTVFVTDGQGEIRNSYQYDAFGIPLETTEQLNNRIRYTGQQYDELTEQYYLRARYYNPVAGRFMQEDVYQGDGLNLYAYCGNNPVVYDDPSGYASTSTGKACPPQGKISESVDETSYGKSREIIQCNTKDAAADELVKRIGGQSRSAFADDPIQREFDVISDQYIAQAKPPLKCVNKTVRTQMKATFEAAKKYERKVYYQFEGIPSQEVLDKLYEHSERYGVEVIIDTEPLGILN